MTTHSPLKTSQSFSHLAAGWVLMLCTFRRSADNEPFANMTNLAVKGIIGVKAMAEISNTLGNVADAKFFGVRTAITQPSSRG